MSHWVSSEIAASYRQFRPQYPPALFDRLAEIVQKFSSPSSSSSSTPQQPKLIVDIGCGSGQAIRGLMQKYNNSQNNGNKTRFIGIDPSEAQLTEARKDFPSDIVQFLQGDGGSDTAGELVQSILAKTNESFSQRLPADLITVAQALHWFSIDNFCQKQLLPSSATTIPLLNPDSGLVAAWFYATTKILNSPECHAILDNFDKKLLRENYWPRERWSIENMYADQIADFKKNGFELVAKEVITDERESSLDSLVQYLNTWSGVQKYETALKVENKGSVIEEAIRKPFIQVLSKGGDGDGETETWKDSPNAIKLGFDFHLFVWKPVSA